jgi:UDPglucose 6-dehydrogenase
MKISVFGAGYVGLVTAACFAEVGHRVTCCDTSVDKVASLRAGSEPME